MKTNMNRNIFFILVLVLLSGCSTVKSDRTPLPADQTLQPIDCTSGSKRAQCLPVASVDKKVQKKTAKSTQSEQMERRARLAKIAENKRINDEKAKVKSEAKSEALPLVQDDTVVSKPDLKAQKQIDSDNREKAFATSMDCVRNKMGKIDDVRKPVRAVAYELALLCRKSGVQMDSVANATVPLISQSRAPRKK